MGSSIIFLVVIAIWAVFLLPDLQTRRHQLAESRTATRVLGASRVLRRGNGSEPAVEAAQAPAHQASAPGTAVTARTGSSPAIEAPTESIDLTGIVGTHSADHVIAARSHAVTASTTGSTSVASLDAEYVDDALAHPEPVEEEVVEPAVAPEVPATPALQRATPRVEEPQDAEPLGEESPVDEPRTEEPRTKGSRLRRARVEETPAGTAAEAEEPRRSEPKVPGRGVTLAMAGLLLASLIAVPVTLVCAALAVVPWPAVLVPVVLLAAAVAGLRMLATRRRAARRARRAVPGARVAEPAPVMVKEKTRPAVAEDPVHEATSMPTPAADDPFFDQDVVPVEVPEPAEAPAVPEPRQGPTAAPKTPRPRVDDRPRQWAPRTVPRPTYLMKPRAPEGRLTAPNIGLADSGHADPFGDLLDGDDDVDLELPQSHAV